MSAHAPQLIAVAIGVALLLARTARTTRRDRNVRADAAEQLFWWGATHGLSAPLPGDEGEPRREQPWSPLDTALALHGAKADSGDQAGFVRDASTAGLSIYLERSTIGRSADRTTLLGAVRGPLCGHPNGAVVAITGDDLESDDNNRRVWVPRFHCTLLIVSDIATRVPGLVICRRGSAGGLALKVDPSLVEVALESTELARRYVIAAPAGVDQVEVRACLTPALQTWLVDAGPELIDLGGANLQVAAAGHLTADAQFDGLVAAATRIAAAVLERPLSRAA